MRIETREIKIFPLSELGEGARKNAHGHYLAHNDPWHFADEAKDTIKAVEELFHIKISHYSIDTYRPQYPDVTFTNWWRVNDSLVPMLSLHGNRARAFLWNNFGRVLCEPRTRYRPKKCKSQIFFDRVYDGTCPLTGVCYDNDALDPMAYFCFGVRWDEKEQKRVQDYKARTLRRDDAVTVESVVMDCVDSMFYSFIEDARYCETMEYFEEMCDANGWEFLEDGTLYK